MKAIVMTASGLKLSEIPMPVPGIGEILVKIEWASVCGSDYPVLNGYKDKSHLVGSVVGHEGSGRVVEIGEKATIFEIGDNVAMESHRARPEWLKQGGDPYTDPLCAIIGYRAFPNGSMPQGTWAEYIALPEVYAHKIPEELNEKYPGSLWEPLGNSIRVASVVEKVGKPKGIVVAGCGPQGIMVLLIMKHWLGFKDMYAVDISPERRGLVEKFGLAKSFPPDKLPQIECGLWLEMSGAIPSYKQGFSRVGPGGTMILFGIPGKTDEMIEGMPYAEFVLQGKQGVVDGRKLIGVVGRLREDWEKAPDIIRAISRNLELGELYSYFGPLENMPHLVSNKAIPPGEGGFLKAVFSSFLL